MGQQQDKDYLLLAAASFSFFMLPTQVHERYLYPAVIFLALAMIRNWRLVVLYAIVAVIFTDNIADIVAHDTAVLFYPSRLFFWQPVQAAAVLTIGYLLFMTGFLRPLIYHRPVAAQEQHAES